MGEMDIFREKKEKEYFILTLDHVQTSNLKVINTKIMGL